jgi:transaldolase/glucose-6-phosphate isomerase
MPGGQTAATVATANPLLALARYGQSVWLDSIRRGLITGGGLARLAREDGACGVTANPAIFENAITGSTDYAEALKTLVRQNGGEPNALYERLAIQDVQAAADILRPVYDGTGRRDGYVSLEVSPDLAHDTAGTVAEARRRWQAIGRENTMIKVPGTPAGVPGIAQLTAERINVDVTLLFSRARYEQVAAAYFAGLERLAAGGGDVSRVASVASFFVSRIDTAVDAIVTARLTTATSASEQALLRRVAGNVAIANARLAYQRYKGLVRSGRWRALAARGAQSQRLLWASTGTKDPAMRDVRYVEELIGPDTVNTVPPTTLDAFRDHGRPRASAEEDLEAAQPTMETQERLGISTAGITDTLLDDGLRRFVEAFEKLFSALAKAGPAAGPAGGPRLERRERQRDALPDGLAAAVEASREGRRLDREAQRRRAGDGSRSTGADGGRPSARQAGSVVR